MDDISPSICIIIPTYNSERSLAKCLSSIRYQKYPDSKIQIFIVDGGSIDKTLEIAAKYNVTKVIKNIRRIEELGRPLAIKATTSELIAFIDSDNILPNPDWLRKMVEPFEDTQIVGSEPIQYTYRKKDGALTRYCSLIGADDAIYPYFENYDRLCRFKGSWTEVPIKVENKKNYLKIKIDKNNIPMMGANGFIVRSNVLGKTEHKFFLHTDLIYRLAMSGKNCFAKVKVGIIHLHGENFSTYLEKKIRRIRKYYAWKNHRVYFPIINRKRKINIVFSAIILIPIIRDVVRGYRCIPDKAWFIHPIALYLSLASYALGIVEAKISMK